MYKEKEHAESLITILEGKSLCVSCPFAISLHYAETSDYVCNTCKMFIGLPKITDPFKDKCPCHLLGVDEANKQSWLALEEKGYLE